MAASVPWNRDEDKAFENAIAMHWVEDDSTEEQWEKIASMVPSKSLEELKQHYQLLAEDVGAIEAGSIPLPTYVGDEAIASTKDFNGLSSGAVFTDKRLNCGFANGSFQGLGHGGKGGSRSDQERRKGIPWTEEEHRLFLLGLEKYGKGDWRSISRNFVISRTPTQVASHAQKYFIRLNSMNRDRRRSSIHDITNVNKKPQAAITGQEANTNTTTGAGAIASATLKHRAQQHMPGLGMYGHPLAAAAPPPHIASAVGTPVILPPPHPPYVVPVAYPIPPPQTMRQ